MDDALVQKTKTSLTIVLTVLILVVMDDALVHTLYKSVAAIKAES